jgi:hypothetical protein
VFKRKAQPPPSLPTELPVDESYERGAAATLFQGKATIRGTLFMTSRRLMFQAAKGEARWLIVPFDEVQRSGIYPAPRPTIGAPRAGQPALFIETTKGEHVWWSFDRKEQDAWLPLIQERGRVANATIDAE